MRTLRPWQPLAMELCLWKSSLRNPDTSRCRSWVSEFVCYGFVFGQSLVKNGRLSILIKKKWINQKLILSSFTPPYYIPNLSSVKHKRKTVALWSEEFNCQKDTKAP